MILFQKKDHNEKQLATTTLPWFPSRDCSVAKAAQCLSLSLSFKLEHSIHRSTAVFIGLGMDKFPLVYSFWKKNPDSEMMHSDYNTRLNNYFFKTSIIPYWTLELFLYFPSSGTQNGWNISPLGQTDHDLSIYISTVDHLVHELPLWYTVQDPVQQQILPTRWSMCYE